MTTDQKPQTATTPTSGAAIQRYKIGYRSYEWGQRSSTPSGIPDASGSWVRYADHVNALAAGPATAAPAQPAPSGATEEVENLRKALVYAAFALHDAPQYMLAQGITLIDGDTVRVSRDGWTVEASVNPHRRPAPATQQARGGAWQARASQGQAPAGAGEAAEHYRNAIARAYEGWTMPDGLRKHLETALWSPPTPQPTQPQAGAVPLTDEYPALVCDYCGALTPDPWHSSGMLHGKMSKHIHSCDACAARGAAQAQDTREPLTPERVKEIVRGAGYDQCGIPDTERAAFINGLRHGEREHGVRGDQHG